MCIPALFDDKADRNACIVARVKLAEMLKPHVLAVSLEVRPHLP